MSPASVAGLFGAMVILAAIPSLSVLLVTTRSASSGLAHGIAVAMGIVLGDLVFIALAILGLSLIAEGMGHWFVFFKYAAGLYLIWLGLRLWGSPAVNRLGKDVQHDSLWSSAASGVLLTLSDQKAVLFYLAFLPAFVDMARLFWLDVVVIVAVMMLAVGGVKTGYAYAAARSQHLVCSRGMPWMNGVAAGVLILTGIIVMVRV